MQITTERFGVVEINEDTIFNFVKPIIGFEASTQYIIIEYDENSPFKWLQSVSDGGLAFPVTYASYFDIDYTFELPDDDVKLLELENVDDLLVLNIANIPNNHPENSTINLLSPVLLNYSNKKAMQTILSNSNFPTRHQLFPQHTTVEI